MSDWPEPEHTSAMPWPEGFVKPSAAVSLLGMAERHGWTGRLTYARGHVPGVGERRNLVHSVAVRFSDGALARGGYVVYEAVADGRKLAWVAKTLMVYGRDHWPVSVGLGVVEVKRYLTDGRSWDGNGVARWGQTLRTELARKKATAAAKAKARPAKAKVHA